MISDQEFLHGAAFLKLINYGKQITVTHVSNIHSSLYIIDTHSHQSAILFKISKKPKSAWPFTVSSNEEIALNKVHELYPKIPAFFALVCHKDGVCCISQKLLQSILVLDVEMSGQHISVSRQPHSSYHISGSGRQQMDQTIPQNDWPRILFNPTAQQP